MVHNIVHNIVHNFKKIILPVIKPNRHNDCTFNDRKIIEKLLDIIEEHRIRAINNPKYSIDYQIIYTLSVVDEYNALQELIDNANKINNMQFMLIRYIWRMLSRYAVSQYILHGNPIFTLGSPHDAVNNAAYPVMTTSGITKTSKSFNYGHYLPDNCGKCYSMHGHESKIKLTVKTLTLDMIHKHIHNDSEFKIIDFYDIKPIFNRIHKKIDHKQIAGISCNNKLEISTSRKNGLMLSIRSINDINQKNTLTTSLERCIVLPEYDATIENILHQFIIPEIYLYMITYGVNMSYISYLFDVEVNESSNSSAYISNLIWRNPDKYKKL